MFKLLCYLSLLFSFSTFAALPISSLQTTNYEELIYSDEEPIPNETVIDDLSYDGWQFNGFDGDTGITPKLGSFDSEYNATGLKIYTSDGSEFDLVSIDYLIDSAGDPNTANLIVAGYKDGSYVDKVEGDFNDTTSGTWDLSALTGIDELRIATNTEWVFFDNFKVQQATPSNNTPTISIADSTLAYTAGDAVTQIDNAATANDDDGDSDWNGGKLEVEITGNAEVNDEISIPDNVVASINTSGTIVYNGVTSIGSLSASEGIVTGGTKLTVTFNGNATNTLVQQVVQAIHYRSTSYTPGTSNRTVTFTVIDKNSALASDTRTISVSPVDSDASLTAGSGVTEPVALPTTATSTGTAVNIFDFTISDGGTNDSLATVVSQIVLHTSGSGDFSKVTWRLNGPDAGNVTGTYDGGANTITFSGLSISVGNGGSETYTVNGYYNDNAGLTEGQTYIFSLDGDTDLTIGGSGTQIGTTSAVNNSTGTTVDITATKLAFNVLPSPLSAKSGEQLVFTTVPVVHALDAANNLDSDFSSIVTLTENGSGTATYTNAAASATGGIATFTGMTVTYIASSLPEIYTLQASGGGLTTADSSTISSLPDNNALLLDATSEYVTIPESDAGALDFASGSFTVEFWLKGNASNSGLTTVLGNKDSSSTTGKGWSLTSDASGNLLVNIADGSNSATFQTNHSLTSTAPTHISVVFERSSSILVYKNGVALTAQSGNPTGITSIGDIGATGGSLVIGQDTASNRPFLGEISELRFWNTARTAEEITENCNITIADSSTGLAGYFRCNEGNGSVLTDLTSNSNHGTVTGAVTRTYAADVHTGPVDELGGTDQTLYKGGEVVYTGGSADNSNAGGGLEITATLGSEGNYIAFGQQNNLTSTLTADLGATSCNTRAARVWFVHENNSGSNTTVVFDIDDFGTNPNMIDDVNSYFLLKRNGISGNFTSVVNATAVDTTEHTVTFTGLSLSRGFYTLGSTHNKLTPVIGLTYSIEMVEDGTEIILKVENEVEVASYRVERKNGANWDLLEEVTADGSHEYSVLDNGPINGEYRVIVVDTYGITQTFTINNSSDYIVYQLKQGWNLLSTPLLIPDSSVAQMNKSFGDIWTWDSQNLAYKKALRLTAGQGFWLYSVNERQFTLKGDFEGLLPTHIDKGWNLIGPQENCYCPEGKTIFCWEKSYNLLIEDASIMVKGAGYWLLSDEEQAIKLY